MALAIYFSAVLLVHVSVPPYFLWKDNFLQAATLTCLICTGTINLLGISVDFFFLNLFCICCTGAFNFLHVTDNLEGDETVMAVLSTTIIIIPFILFGIPVVLTVLKRRKQAKESPPDEIALTSCDGRNNPTNPANGTAAGNDGQLTGRYIHTFQNKYIVIVLQYTHTYTQVEPNAKEEDLPTMSVLLPSHIDDNAESTLPGATIRAQQNNHSAASQDVNSPHPTHQTQNQQQQNAKSSFEESCESVSSLYLWLEDSLAIDLPRGPLAEDCLDLPSIPDLPHFSYVDGDGSSVVD